MTHLELGLQIAQVLKECDADGKVTIQQVRDLHHKLLEIFDQARKEADCAHEPTKVHGNYCFECGRNLAKESHEKSQTEQGR